MITKHPLGTMEQALTKENAEAWQAEPIGIDAKTYSTLSLQ